jgi:hypothetical protein
MIANHRQVLLGCATIHPSVIEHEATKQASHNLLKSDCSFWFCPSLIST